MTKTKQQVLETLQARLTNGESYGTIAKELDINKGTLHMFINTDYIPKSMNIRKKLDLAPMTQIMSISGEILYASISLGSRVCKCGQAFIPNHGLRHKCFICRPFRPYKKKRSIE